MTLNPPFYSKLLNKHSTHPSPAARIYSPFGALLAQQSIFCPHDAVDGSGLAEKAANFADSRRSALACLRSWPWHDSTNAQPGLPKTSPPKQELEGHGPPARSAFTPKFAWIPFSGVGKRLSQNKRPAQTISLQGLESPQSLAVTCARSEVWIQDSAHPPQLYLIVCPLVGKLDWIDKAWTPSFGKDGLVGVWQRRMVWMRIHRESRGLRR